jgi:hypothetical protein
MAGKCLDGFSRETSFNPCAGCEVPQGVSVKSRDLEPFQGRVSFRGAGQRPFCVFQIVTCDLFESCLSADELGSRHPARTLRTGELVTLLRERELIDAGKSKVIVEAWERSSVPH